MISINKVRNTVMFLLEKENRGYIFPTSFDSYCDLAQMTIFEDLFFEYNQWLNKENKRLTGTDFANIPKNLRQQIDVFTEYTDDDNFTYDEITKLWSYTGTDLYRPLGLSLVNTETGKKVDIEEVTKSELNMLINSNKVSPTTTWPAYIKLGESFRVFPIVSEDYSVELYYARRPKTPKWTFTNVSGNPVYNPSASDLQNIELEESLYPRLVVKVMGYCGVSIREADVVNMSSGEEAKQTAKQS